jgi:hypothetical protein
VTRLLSVIDSRWAWAAIGALVIAAARFLLTDPVLPAFVVDDVEFGYDDGTWNEIWFVGEDQSIDDFELRFRITNNTTEQADVRTGWRPGAWFGGNLAPLSNERLDVPAGGQKVRSVPFVEVACGYIGSPSTLYAQAGRGGEPFNSITVFVPSSLAEEVAAEDCPLGSNRNPGE